MTDTNTVGEETNEMSKLMEEAFIACGTLNYALKASGVSRAERRRAMRFVTKGFGQIEGR